MRRAHLPSLLEKICWTLTGSATRHAQGTLMEVRARVVLLRTVILMMLTLLNCSVNRLVIIMKMDTYRVIS